MTVLSFVGWLYPTDFQGLQWCLLKEGEVVPCILAMETHRGSPKSLEIQRTNDLFHSRQRKRRPPSVAESEVANATLIKLQRKLEAQGEPLHLLRLASWFWMLILQTKSCYHLYNKDGYFAITAMVICHYDTLKIIKLVRQKQCASCIVLQLC